MEGWHFYKASQNTVSYCLKEKKPCVLWVDKYFKDCLCNLRDDFSFGFGLLSLLVWGVAEIPQIITNVRTKSSHGVSLNFLLLWFVGNIFNLVGCLLEPATLPTQYYTAMLYTTNTVVLVLQSLYYDHFNTWWKYRQIEEEVISQPLNPKATDDYRRFYIPSAPIRASLRRYYTSARSPFGRSGPQSAPSALGSDYHSDDDEAVSVSILTKNGSSKPRYIPRYAVQGAMLAASVTLPFHGNALSEAYMGFTGRRVMLSEIEHNDLGQSLGWLMAAIYVSGRIPQIVLNIKRGSVQGLNPLMFIFALIANLAYVASILVRSTEWDKIKPNLPWLLDCIFCVVLDFFVSFLPIIMQYMYYRYVPRTNPRAEEQDYFYEEAQKSLVS